MFKKNGKKTRTNFKSKDKMLDFLDNNPRKLSQMKDAVVNFAALSLPLKTTVWKIDK